MTNQTSIQYISSLLNNPGSINDGDQSSISLFRQTFPYFVPMRYIVALESHRKLPFTPQMLGAMKPYMGDWILFCDFLKKGCEVAEREPAAAGATEKKSSEIYRNIAGEMNGQNTFVNTPVMPAERKEPAKPAAPEVKKEPEAPATPAPRPDESVVRATLEEELQAMAPILAVVEERPEIPVVLPIPNAEPLVEVPRYETPLPEPIAIKEEAISITPTEPAPLAAQPAELPAAPEVAAPVPEAMPEPDQEQAVPQYHAPEEGVGTEPEIEIPIMSVPPVMEPISSVVPVPVRMLDEDEAVAATAPSSGVHHYQVPVPMPVSIPAEEEPLFNPPKPTATDEHKYEIPLPQAVATPASEESTEQQPAVNHERLFMDMIIEHEEVHETTVEATLPVHAITEVPEAVAYVEPVQDMSAEEPADDETLHTEILTEESFIYNVSVVSPALPEETPATEPAPQATAAEDLSEALEIVDVRDTTAAEPAHGRRDHDPLIFPIYTRDYFLQQGEKISEEIPLEINELRENAPMFDKDRSLMVVMSFTEWLLHFKNAAARQQEETKDQRALKTMWQKEKLAAAIEEENEEIPESVFAMAVNSISKEEGLVSDTLAEIYAKQGKYDKAIEMYRKLSLKNPQKSAYFAAKIEEALKDKES